MMPNNDPKQRDPVLKDLFASAAEAASMNTLMESKVFDIVKNNYNQLKKTFQQALEQNEKVMQIVDLQNYASLRFDSLLLSPHAISAFISQNTSKKSLL